MYLILGATGHVGSTVANALLQQGYPVTALLHTADHVRDWEQRGARTAVIDVHDVEALRQVFRQGKRLFLLNPPAAPATDTAAEERKSVRSLLAALSDSGLEKIVAQSTYGAQPGEDLGDLGVLYNLEQGLRAQPIPHSILRGAYYMSNWDAALSTAQQQGTIPTFYPLDFQLPMVAPQDLGEVAAHVLTEPFTTNSLHYVEGPARYSAADVAAAFARALDQPVQAHEIPQDQWSTALQQQGFSKQATISFAAMTAQTKQGEFPAVAEAVHGVISLQRYIHDLVNKKA